MERDRLDIVLALILCLNDMGFDFEKNSALDLMLSIKELSKMTVQSDSVRAIFKECLEEVESCKTDTFNIIC